jgi:RNA polymerase sigma factor (sigma-70 family)
MVVMRPRASFAIFLICVSVIFTGFSTNIFFSPFPFSGSACIFICAAFFHFSRQPENSSGDTGSPSAPPYGEPEACLLQNAYAQTVQDAIQHLNRNEQTVIQFYYFRQETTNEIAVRLGCSVQNVRKIKRRALTRLRSLLER